MKNENLIFLILISISFIQCQNSAQTISQKQDPQKEVYNKNNLVGYDFDASREKDISKKFGFKIIDSLTTVFQGKSIEILFERIEDWDDPGDFHRISIDDGKEIITIFNINGWVQPGAFEKQYVDGEKINSLHSCFLSQASEDDLLLFATGYTYASKPGVLSIINLSRFCHPALIYNDNTLLYDLGDVNMDGVVDIQVTTRSFDEFDIEYLSTYLLISGSYLKHD